MINKDSASSIYWHDYETFGSNPRKDRPCQFAGVRTDLELNIIDDPLVMFCKPAPDFLPDPGACKVTGITPIKALEEGVSEAEFCARIEQQFSQPGTCVAGYNSIRFDDEVTRHLLYRCFYDPYEREWKNGNSRWDIIDMVRLTHAVRPDGIHWPQREDGAASFRLEDLTRANTIGHEGAHDALSDVIATIEVAKLVRRHQPRLYDFLFSHRHKSRIFPLLDVSKREPVLHVSAMYPASRGCLAVVIPLAQHRQNRNEIIVCDLGENPAHWLGLSAEALQKRLFTRTEELPEAEHRIGLKTVHVNKCPVIAPLSVLDDNAARRWGIDLAMCKQHLQQLEAVGDLEEKLVEVFSRPPVSDSGQDPDLMLYSGGFFSDRDKHSLRRIRTLSPAELAAFKADFDDPRIPQLLFRYRARNFPECLNADENATWLAFCQGRILAEESIAGVNWQEFHARLEELASDPDVSSRLVQELGSYADKLGSMLSITKAG
ncbi:MAG: exodeoxyribonuclease I [Pseudohongiellaceae bacterium]